jgi:hypothetical protein
MVPSETRDTSNPDEPSQRYFIRYPSLFTVNPNGTADVTICFNRCERFSHEDEIDALEIQGFVKILSVAVIGNTMIRGIRGVGHVFEKP